MNVYTAFSGMKLDGDKIKKLYDLSCEKDDQTFSGSDRPEKMRALANTGAHQISVEKESTNHVLYSNQFDDSEWDKFDAVVSNEGHDNVIGGDVWKLAESTDFDDDWVRLRQSGVLSNTDEGVEKVLRLYAKAGTKSRMTAGLSTGTRGGSIGGIIELSTGEVIDNGSDANRLSVQYIKDGWWYIEIAGANDNDGNTRYNIQVVADDADTFGVSFSLRYNADGNGYIYIANAQAEYGQYATNYIDTAGSTVTRLEPEPILENFLPSTDSSEPLTIAQWFDIIVDENSHVWSMQGDPLNNRIWIISGLNIQLAWTGLVRFLEDLSAFEFQRVKRFVCLTQVAGQLQIFICDEDGNLKNSRDISYDDSEVHSSANFGLGIRGDRRQRSLRMENIQVLEKHLTIEQVKQLYVSTSKYEGGPNLTLNDVNFTDQS